MSRLINVDDIKITGSTYVDENDDIFVALSDVRNAIQLTPTANVKENIYGKWIFDDEGYARCSICHQKAPILLQYQDEPITNMTKYCPCCGSEMTTADSPRLYKELYDELKSENIEPIKNINKNIKAAKIKTIEEFVEKLKEKAYRHNCRYNGNPYDIVAVTTENIDDVMRVIMDDVNNE